MGNNYSTDDPWRNAMVGMNFLGNAMRTGQQIGEARYEKNERDAVDKAYEYIVGKLGPSGDLSALENDPILFTRHGAQAAGAVAGDRMNTEKYRLEFLKNRETGDQKYFESFFMPQVNAAMQAFNNGDMASYSSLINEISATFPAPYKTQARPDGNFDLLFRSDQHGDWVKKDVMTPQEVNAQLADMMNGTQNVVMGADMKPHPVNTRLLSMMARYRMGTAKKNAENLQDPSKWLTLTKNGHTIRVVPQNRHDDYSGGVNWMVLDDSGKVGGMVGDLNALIGQGYRPLEVQAKDAQLRRTIAGRQGGNNALGNSAMTDALLRAGYTYDKTYKRWFKTVPDENGKLAPDMTKPLTEAEYREIASGLGGDDPLGILPPKTKPGTKTGNGKGNVKEKADKPQGTEDAKLSGAMPDVAGSEADSQNIPEDADIIRLSTWPEERWGFIGKDGRPVPISREQAQQIFILKDKKAAQAPPLFFPLQKRENPDGTMTLVRKQ